MIQVKSFNTVTTDALVPCVVKSSAVMVGWLYVHTIHPNYVPDSYEIIVLVTSQISKFMGPTWGPPGSSRPQMGPMLAPWTLLSGLIHLSLSGVPDLWDRNKILSGGDLSHYQVPHCIRVFFYFVWFVFIHHNFQFYFELCTYCNILDIYLS